jgi:hypothetical protein
MVGETEIAADSLDVDGAVALIGGEGEPERESAPAARSDSGDARASDADDEPADDEEAEASDTGETVDEATAEDDVPEFWSAEDKAAWKAVPAELRPVLKKYEQQRIEFVNEKAREAAAVRAQAIEEVQRANRTADEAATWWRQYGPALQKAFASKWSQVDWKGLAEKDPAEVARLMQQRQDEEALLAETSRRGEADMQAAQARAEQALAESRRVEHAKLAHKLPKYFGTPETSQKTYDELNKFLFAKGIPADRINATYEAPIVELALNAMLFEQARKKASAATRTARFPAQRTPTRVAPGPATWAGNRNADAARQVGRRFRESGGASIADAAELIRLNGL